LSLSSRHAIFNTRSDRTSLLSLAGHPNCRAIRQVWQVRMLRSKLVCRRAVGTRLFREAGGMPPAMFRPSAKPRSGRYLSFAEREEIALLRVQGCSMREVGRRLGRTASTISRELRRNAATRSGSLEHAERSARRPKQAKLALNATLRTYVEERLAGIVVAPGGAPVPGPAVRWKGRRHGPRKHRRWANAWSLEQIACRLPVDFPDDETMRISHEAIYQALFVQSRGALHRELTSCLRTGRALRTPRARTRGRGKTFIFPEIMISRRPAEAADRAVPGHWEGDLILGLGSSAIGTLVERMIPSQRPTQLLRQGDNRSRNGVEHRLGTLSGECGPRSSHEPHGHGPSCAAGAAEE
jgi:IS30 family transposase